MGDIFTWGKFPRGFLLVPGLVIRPHSCLGAIAMAIKRFCVDLQTSKVADDPEHSGMVELAPSPRSCHRFQGSC